MDQDRQFIYSLTPATPIDFIEYWSARYEYREEFLYDNNIRRTQTPNSLEDLFRWKIGARFFEAHGPIVQQFINRIEVARKICASVTAEEFLAVFSEGGAIYRIFWIHCWQPDRFPIYDQHVHRAMTFLQNGTREDLGPFSNDQKIRSYIDTFVPFIHRFDAVKDPRKVDRALWAFGKFIKKPVLPIK